MAAIGAGQRGEIRVRQIGARDAAGKAAFLMHADGAVAAVIGDQNDHRRAMLGGC